LLTIPAFLEQTLASQTRSEQHYTGFTRPVHRGTSVSEDSQREPRQTDRTRTSTETSSRPTVRRLDRFLLPRETSTYSCEVLEVGRTYTEYGQEGSDGVREYLAGTDRKGQDELQEEGWERWKDLPRSNRSPEQATGRRKGSAPASPETVHIAFARRGRRVGRRRVRTRRHGRVVDREEER